MNVKNVDESVYDRIPISPVPCNEKVFDCRVMDCLGPLFPNQKVKYNYCLVLCDQISRFPDAFCLPSLTGIPFSQIVGLISQAN